MRPYRNLILIIFTLIILIPTNANAKILESGDGTKYVLEKQNLQCDLININDNDIVRYHGRDKDSNFVYNVLNSNDYYKVNINGCSKMSVEESLNFLSYNENTWYEVQGTNINRITQGEFDISYVEVSNENIDSTKNYCQFNSIINSFTCGILASNVDMSKPFYQNTYIKHINSLEIDSSLKYYIISDSNTSVNTLVEVTPENVKLDIAKDSQNAFNYYVILNDYRTTEFFSKIENETILNLLKENENICESVVYNEKTNLFYFSLYDPSVSELVVYNSNGEKVNTSYQLRSAFSNSLLYGYEPDSNKAAIIDSTGNAIYETTDMWILEESNYNNYVLELDNIDSDDQVTFYKLYEYKLLSEDNRIADKKRDFEIKFSGLLEKVKLDSIKVNENILNESNYVLKSGSTVITLSKDYLNTLEEGKYTLTIEYIDGVTLSSTFYISDSIKVTFDANGGKFENAETHTIDDWHYSDYDSLIIPVREGYQFKGYFTEKKDGTSLENILNESGIDRNMVFYAQWEKLEENPETSDSISSNIIMFVVSLIGLALSTIYLKKETK